MADILNFPLVFFLLLYRMNSKIDFLSIFEYDTTQEEIVIKLTAENYDYHNADLTLNSSCKIVSENHSTIRCQRLLVTCPNVTIEGVKFEGSIVQRYGTGLVVEDCEFFGCNTSGGGSIVLTFSTDAKITNCVFHDQKAPGIFIETESAAFIDNVKMTNMDDRGIVVSYLSQAEVQNSEFTNLNNSSIICQYNSFMKLNQCNTKNVHALGLSFTQAFVSMEGCKVEDIEQNGINVYNCIGMAIRNCEFKNTGSSSISITNQEQPVAIFSNKFSDIHGNAVIMNEGSKAEIHSNEMTNIDYPAVAVLDGSVAVIEKNRISQCAKAGMCVRASKDVIIRENQVSEIFDTGISVSDSTNVEICKNEFVNCRVAGVESYNQSVVTCIDNVFRKPGKTGLMSYAGATLHAKKNKIIEPEEAMVLISTHGSGDFVENECEKCAKQYIGETTGEIYMQGNSKFENITNDEKRVTEEVKLIPPFEDPKKGKCLKCGLVDREGFLSPCGHKIFCKKCGEEAAKNKELCPLCRFPIESFTSGYSNSNDDTCSICMTNKADAVVLPCGHTGVCSQCLNDWFNSNTSCPVCRTEKAFYKRILSDF